MEWHIAPLTRVDLHVWSGINFSGEHRVVSVHPAGGRQGQTIEGFTFQSVAVSGPPGIRVTFCTSALPEGWEAKPWRAVSVQKGLGYKTKEGKQAVRVPDLDCLDAPNAPRTDPDFQLTIPAAADLGTAKGWTYGRPGELKGKVVVIRIDKTDPGEAPVRKR
jgi:hypothetical protein